MRSAGRAIGLDVHRDFCEVAIAHDGELRSSGRVDTTPERLELFGASLDPRDRVALEVSGSAWEVARILERHVARVVVVSPADTGIRQARAKTDRLDARTLARLLAAGELDGVWSPDGALPGDAPSPLADVSSWCAPARAPRTRSTRCSGAGCSGAPAHDCRSGSRAPLALGRAAADREIGACSRVFRRDLPPGADDAYRQGDLRGDCSWQAVDGAVTTAPAGRLLVDRRVYHRQRPAPATRSVLSEGAGLRIERWALRGGLPFATRPPARFYPARPPWTRHRHRRERTQARMPVHGFCLTRGEDYAHQQPSLTAKKLRLKAGDPRRRPHLRAHRPACGPPGRRCAPVSAGSPSKPRPPTSGWSQTGRPPHRRRRRARA